MAKTATSKSQQGKDKSAQNPHRRLNIIIIPALIVIAVVVAYGAYFYFSHRPHTQAQAHESLQDISAQLNFPGTLVYEKITDQGCGPNPTTWLSLKDICTVSLDKFYKASGSAEANLRAADGIIVGEGWERDTASTAASEYDRIFTSRNATYLSYLYPESKKPRIILHFFPRDDTRYNGETAQQFLGIDQDIPLTGDEYIYGVQISSTYGK